MANPTPAPTEPLADCLDPVGPYNQCGGEDYEGSDCCRDGYQCTEMASCYSQVSEGRTTVEVGSFQAAAFRDDRFLRSALQ